VPKTKPSQNSKNNGSHKNGSIALEATSKLPELSGLRALRPQLARAKRKAFLKILARTLNVTRAAKAVKSDRSQVYEWRKDDTEFAEAWDSAIKTAIDEVESTVHGLATGQYTRMVVSAGKHLGDEQIFDVRAAELLLKGRRREVYGERSSLSITGADGGPIRIEKREVEPELVRTVVVLLGQAGLTDFAGLAGQPVGTTLAVAEASRLPEHPA
jgi:hypothetical protein